MNNYSNRIDPSLEQEMRSFLNRILEGLKTKLGMKEKPNSLYYYKEGETYLELDPENNILYLNWFLIWSPFYDQFLSNLINTDKIIEFITIYFQEYLQIKNIYPASSIDMN